MSLIDAFQVLLDINFIMGNQYHYRFFSGVTFSPFCKRQTEAKLHISPTKMLRSSLYTSGCSLLRWSHVHVCLTERWPGPVDTGCRQLGQSIPGARHAVGGAFARLKVIQYVIRCIIIINIKKRETS